jgi:hypothetical protein
MDYTTLIAGKSTTGSIRRWVNRDSVDVEAIIPEAQEWIERTLRVREQLRRTTALVTAVGSATVTPPVDLISPLVWQITGPQAYGAIPKRSAFTVENSQVFTGTASQSNGRPSYYYHDETLLVLDKPADAIYTTRMLYHAKANAIGTATTTNYLTGSYSRLFRLALMGMANEWLKDSEQAKYWIGLADAEVSRANVAFEMLQENGGLDDVMPPYWSDN